MSLLVKDKVFENADEGIHNAVVTRVDDLGLVETSFGTKDRVRIVFRTEQKGTDGQFLDVRIDATKSLNEKATLGKFLRSLKINPEGSFDLNDLVGLKLQIVVKHNKGKDGKTYANVDSVVPVRSKKPVSDTDEL